MLSNQRNRHNLAFRESSNWRSLRRLINEDYDSPKQMGNKADQTVVRSWYLAQETNPKLPNFKSAFAENHRLL